MRFVRKPPILLYTNRRYPKNKLFSAYASSVSQCKLLLEIRPSHRSLEVGGTWYATEFQRTAVNTECKYLLLKHAFEVLGCICVQFKADARNLRSLRAIKRLGAAREGMLRNHYILANGRLRDSVYFSILDKEWPGSGQGWKECWRDNAPLHLHPGSGKTPYKN